MKYLLLSILTLILFSCVTKRRCNEKFPPSLFSFDSTYVKDSILIVHDTIILRGENVIIKDTIPCPELEYHSQVKKNNLTAKVDIHKGVLKVECIEDSLKKVIEKQNHLITTLNNRITKETSQPIYSHTITKFDSFTYLWFGISLIILIAFIYLKFKP